VTATVTIGRHAVGAGKPCLVIAEAGVNHNGDLAMAHRLVDVAADAGADVVKFQTFAAERLADRNAPKAPYQLETTSTAESQFEMLKRLELDEAGHVALMQHCAARGILFMSSPFDELAADLLDRLGVAAFKIPSGEIDNLPFLRHVARKGRPMIVSTGMATQEESSAAVDAIRHAGNSGVVLLHCLSNYPADPAETNLRAIGTMTAAFGVPVGFSDHTMGTAVSLAAVALGACVIEKHFTLLPGPDHRASLEPGELKTMVAMIRTVESALGDGIKRPQPSETAVRDVARKSLFAARELTAGAAIAAGDLIARRPGIGISPAQHEGLIGRRLRVTVAAGTLLDWSMLA
jgi:N-acetylneuraminate synthase/N,N'-diacetyllegionaminate synthase